MSDLAKRISELSPEKRALLARKMQRQRDGAESRPAEAGAEPLPQREAGPPAGDPEIDRHRLLREWSGAGTALRDAPGLLARFETRVASDPAAAALEWEGGTISRGELGRRAAGWARRLLRLGVAAEARVAICARPSPDAVAAMLGVLAAGGACVPLDPDGSEERLSAILEDARPALLITEGRLAGRLAADRVLQLSGTPLEGGHDLPAVDGGSLAWILYEGEARDLRGAMLSHAAAGLRLAALDELSVADSAPTGRGPGATGSRGDLAGWMWPLASGAPRRLARTQEPAIDFSLFFFTGDGSGSGADKYRLVLESARFADRNGFAAIWTPERHFHPFGGLYPNPSVMSAALAMVTERLQLRAGSVVLPLHNPLRVAEEWALVDNLSHGRVGVAFASGWHPNDFILAPDGFPGRREATWSGIEVLQRLWKGESVRCRGGAGNELEARVFPRPLQDRLPIWITSGGSPETFVKAGELGANLLTNLLGQTLAQVQENVRLYRESLALHGHDPASGCVTLMLHTFVGEDFETVREQVRGPFCNYLKTFTGLLDGLARSLGLGLGRNALSEADMEALLAHAFDRYFSSGALFGTPESCLETLDRLRDIGVDEVGCLIDFGIDEDAVLGSLEHLARLRRLEVERSASARPKGAAPSDLLGVDESAGWVAAFGRPLPGTSVYLLAGDGDLAPAGAAGELNVGGAGLVRGFFGRPDLTADLLRPDPWSEAPGSRLLRTGRWARHRPDGGLELVPREVPA